MSKQLPYSSCLETALRSARFEASRFGATEVTPVHLLMGLIAAAAGAASQAFAAYEVNLGSARKAVYELFGAEKPTNLGEDSFSPLAKRMLESAAARPRYKECGCVTTSDLLLVLLLLCEEEKAAGDLARVLNKLDVALSGLRSGVVALRPREAPAPATVAT